MPLLADRHSVSEVPAGGAVGLGGCHADGGVQREAVQVPGRGARAGRAVRGRERVALHRSRPAARAVDRRHTLQRGRPGGPRPPAPGRCHASAPTHCTPGSPPVARLERARPAREVHRADAALGLPAVKKADGSHSVNTTLTNPRSAPETEVCTVVIASARCDYNFVIVRRSDAGSHDSRNFRASSTNSAWYWKMPPCPASG